ncbi:kynurenine formamidase-like [Centruroides vittatus]|uniref:kynurenine formamidase-like n=1 Tax=Centruroides vittatus TaxID=120091 RepID=UPI00350F04C8
MTEENNREEREYNPNFWSRRDEPKEALTNHAFFIHEITIKTNEKVPHRSKVKYGDAERCVMDIYSEDLPGTSPIFVYVHGGGWVIGNNDLYGYIAEPLRDSGIVLITIEYDLAPFVTLPKMVDEIKQSLTFIVNLARKRGSKGIYLSGHSAGAHLAAMAISSDWMDNPVNRRYLRAVVLISGIYDLSPIIKMSFGDIANFTQETAETTSPIKVINEISKRMRPDFKILVVVAEFDPPKYIEQAKTYHKVL